MGGLESMANQYRAIEENIALLALLDPKLEPAMQHTAPVERRDSAGPLHRTLSFKHEKQTAETFAILFADTDDPNQVGAVCVEEKPEGSGLIIRTAINSGPQTNRVKSLRFIINRLKLHMALGDRNARTEQLMDDIVNISQLRLLGRLRSRHAQASLRSRKPAILPKLQHAVSLLNTVGSPPSSYAMFKKFSNLLVDLFTRLEELSTKEAHSKAGRELLKQILASIENMLASVDLKAIFAPIPRNISPWSGSARENLIERLQRLAQYRLAAQYLLGATRKYPIFRNLEVVELSNASFQTEHQCQEKKSDQNGFFTRVMAQKDALIRRNSELAIQSRWGKDLAGIRQAIMKHSKKGKRVHAEIQLLLYYEQHPEILLPPRVVCSSKYACFLCNLFITVHGGFYIPGSHGRIYPRWKIPRLENLNLSDNARNRAFKWLVAFNEALECKIRHCLELQPLRLPDPNESIIFNPASITPSVLSAAPADETSTRDPSDHTNSSSTFTVGPKSPSASAASSSASERKSSPQTAVRNPSPTPPLGSPSPTSKPSHPFATSTPTDGETQTTETDVPPTTKSRLTPDRPLHRLARNVPVALVLSCGSTARFHTPRIHVELTYENARSIASNTSCTSPSSSPDSADVAVDVEWVEAASQDDSRRMFDLGMEWTHLRVPEGALMEQSGIALRKRDEVVVIRASL